VQLANAFLDILGRRSRDQLILESNSGHIEATARMPAMVLVPLIHHALAYCAKRVHDDDGFRIDVAVKNDRLQLAIRDQGPGFAAEGANAAPIRDVRARLSAVYGQEAKLTLGEDMGGTLALLEFPYETVSAGSGAHDTRHDVERRQAGQFS
jgi:LytS/YehU family sensor histidine kinase